MDHLTKGGRIEITIHARELGVVEDIEELGAEFQVLSFSEASVLGEGHVEVAGFCPDLFHDF